MSSVYEKKATGLITEAIAQENSGGVGVYYAKKEAISLISAGVQFPKRLQAKIASDGIIRRFSENVNMNIRDATQSQQLTKWFGDWQNQPEKASKVVNPDGTPKNEKNTRPDVDRTDVVFAEVEGKASYAGIPQDELADIQSIGRKSVNNFNASDIRLTERLARRYFGEMGAKSPFFRAWFGDWRANDRTPITVAKQSGSTRGVHKNIDTGWEISISGKVFSETKVQQSSTARAAVKYLPYLDDIIENAVLLDSSSIGKAKSSNSVLMHSMYTVADIGNGLEVLKLFVEEMNDPNRSETGKRAYQLRNIEKASAASVRVQGKSPSSITNTTNATLTIADLFAYVKKKDVDFHPERASKVTNPDGTPKVVYHGSRGNFTVFDYSKLGSTGTAEGKGFYFAESREMAERYAENGTVYEAYLNIRKPLSTESTTITKAQVKKLLAALPTDIQTILYSNWGDMATDGKYLVEKAAVDGILDYSDNDVEIIHEIINEAGYGNQELADFYKTLKDTLGYDGIISDSWGDDGIQYIPFQPNQIKSATENIGTFDKDNPDIRYSR